MEYLTIGLILFAIAVLIVVAINRRKARLLAAIRLWAAGEGYTLVAAVPLKYVQTPSGMADVEGQEVYDVAVRDGQGNIRLAIVTLNAGGGQGGAGGVNVAWKESDALPPA
jgi:hypothetical protein